MLGAEGVFLAFLGLIHPIHLKPHHFAALFFFIIIFFMQLSWEGLKMVDDGSP